MGDQEHTTDFVIIGSGAGGLCAALTARAIGAEVLVLEKEAMIGGNSALSGGTMWIPGNALMREAGIPDSVEDRLTYLNGIRNTRLAHQARCGLQRTCTSALRRQRC